MEIMHFHTWLCLFVAIIIGKLSQIAARPAYEDYIAPANYGPVERFDYDYYQPDSKPLTESNVNRLRRGYYYIDDGYITSVPAPSVPVRRQDPISSGNVQYTPLIKFKHTHTKRKKLFVPNLFG